jgi:hypothetical protein
MSRVISGLAEKQQRNVSVMLKSQAIEASTSENQPSLQFAEWLAKQSRRKDLIGSLSRSVRSDTCWPQNAVDYITYRNHLRIDHADWSITRIIALDYAWEEFSRFQADLLIPSKKGKS